MRFYPTEWIALFIDGANPYAAAKTLSFDIDYKRLLALSRSKGQLVRALRYTALAEDQEYSSTHPPVVADELRWQAGHFIDLLDPQHEIGRTPNERSPGPGVRCRIGRVRSFGSRQDLSHTTRSLRR